MPRMWRELIQFFKFFAIAWGEFKQSKWNGSMIFLYTLLGVIVFNVIGTNVKDIAAYLDKYLGRWPLITLTLFTVIVALLICINLFRRGCARIIVELKSAADHAEKLAERIARLESIVNWGSDYSVKLQYQALDISAWRNELKRATENAAEFNKLNEQGAPDSKEEQKALVDQYLKLTKTHIDGLREAQKARRIHLTNRSQKLMPE
jgi:hypothetical protein